MNLFTKSLFFVIFVTLGVLITSNRVNGSDIKKATAEFTDKVQGFINFIFDPDNNHDDEATIAAIFEKGSGLEIGKNYLYRIHENPITNNDCETAGGVLDPNHFGKDPSYKCDRTLPEKCEVGDLSGKHGDLIPNDNGEVIKSVIDSCVKLDGPSGITGRSVVIRLDDKNQTIIACANIYLTHDRYQPKNFFVLNCIDDRILKCKQKFYEKQGDHIIRELREKYKCNQHDASCFIGDGRHVKLTAMHLQCWAKEIIRGTTDDTQTPNLPIFSQSSGTKGNFRPPTPTATLSSSNMTPIFFTMAPQTISLAQNSNTVNTSNTPLSSLKQADEFFTKLGANGDTEELVDFKNIFENERITVDQIHDLTDAN